MPYGRSSGSEEGSDDLVTLNFKVSSEFRKAFKVYAAQNGITMLALLEEGFRLSKERRR